MRVFTAGEMNAMQRTWLVDRLSSHELDSATMGDCLFVWHAEADEAVAAIDQHPSVEWVHTRAAGVPERLLEACVARSLTLTNGSGAHGSAIAEFVVGALLCLYKRVPELLDGQRHRVWRSDIEVDELRDKTVGILGLGALGRACARLLAPFGVQLIGLRRSAGAVPEFDEVFPITELASVLPRCSALVIAAPLTDSTRGLIGRRELDRLPPTAVLVNVGRGPILDEGALAEALRDGRLRAAALDVFSEEPLPTDSPLWSAPNLIISPHRADATPQTARRELELFAENLERWIAGAELHNVVDLTQGY